MRQNLKVTMTDSHLHEALLAMPSYKAQTVDGWSVTGWWLMMVVTGLLWYGIYAYLGTPIG